jgi:outer membrane protein assembly factor BamA
MTRDRHRRKTLARYLFLLTLLFSSPDPAAALTGHKSVDDSIRPLVIDRITVEGNKQTRSRIILRELPFREKDTIPLNAIAPMLRKGRENVFNTRLFNFVTIDTSMVEGEPPRVDVHIHVIERWYIWPWPYFEISDRNFNSWVQSMDFSRLTYGINLTLYNVRGRNETLLIPIHFGFNQKYGFAYKVPYINKKQTIGLGFGGAYDRNHEVIVGSVDNKPVWYKDPDDFPRQDVFGYAEMLVRPTFYANHTIRFVYQHYFFSDSLRKIPGYVPDSLSETGFFSLYYQYKNDHRDFHFYPLKGYYFDFELINEGFFTEPVNNFYIKSTFRKYWHIFNRWYIATGLFGKVTLTKDQPYFLQRGLGYGREYVRGYEYYVVDGQHYALWKNNVKFAILPQRVFKIGFLRSTKFNTVPYALYLNVFTDLGYVYNRDEHANRYNDLQNSLLVGYGVGFDFTTYYDVVVRLEFSMNGMGIPGIYLHFMAPI